MKKSNKKTTKKLATTNHHVIKGGMIRETIVARMKALDWSAYKLAKQVTGKVAGPSVYDYIKGRNDMTGARIVHLLEALGLKICSASDTTPDNIRKSRRSSKTL